MPEDRDECAFDDGTHCFAGYCRCGQFSPGVRDLTLEEREEFDRAFLRNFRRRSHRPAAAPEAPR